MMKSTSISGHDNSDRLFDYTVWMVWAHFFIAGAHVMTHLTLGVPLAVWQMAFVGLIIVALPVVGAVMMRKGDLKTGSAMVAVTMFMSLVFGVLFHFVLDTPDHICGLPSTHWTIPFIVTAVLLFSSELAGTVLGFRAWRKATRP